MPDSGENRGRHVSLYASTVYSITTGIYCGFVPRTLTWLDIRAEFLRLKRERGLTQVQIAKAGGTVQHNISKWLRNERQGPQIGNFMKAIAGLGLSPAEFFSRLEQQHQAIRPVSHPPRMVTTGLNLERLIAKIEKLAEDVKNVRLGNSDLHDRLAAIEKQRHTANQRQPALYKHR